MLKAPPIAVLLLTIILLTQSTHRPLHSPTLLPQPALALVGNTDSNAPNFTLTVYPLSQTVRIGEQATYKITLNSTNGFTGQVSLRTENFPQELLQEFNAKTITLTANNHASSILTVNTISVGEQTFYQFRILATSGSITQRVSASLTVSAESAPPSIASYVFLAGILLFAGFVVWYGLRYRRSNMEQGEEINDEPKPPPV